MNSGSVGNKESNLNTPNNRSPSFYDIPYGKNSGIRQHTGMSKTLFDPTKQRNNTVWADDDDEMSDSVSRSGANNGLVSPQYRYGPHLSSQENVEKWIEESETYTDEDMISLTPENWDNNLDNTNGYNDYDVAGSKKEDEDEDEEDSSSEDGDEEGQQTDFTGTQYNTTGTEYNTDDDDDDDWIVGSQADYSHNIRRRFPYTRVTDDDNISVTPNPSVIPVVDNRKDPQPYLPISKKIPIGRHASTRTTGTDPIDGITPKHKILKIKKQNKDKEEVTDKKLVGLGVGIGITSAALAGAIIGTAVGAVVLGSITTNVAQNAVASLSAPDIQLPGSYDVTGPTDISGSDSLFNTTASPTAGVESMPSNQLSQVASASPNLNAGQIALIVAGVIVAAALLALLIALIVKYYKHKKTLKNTSTIIDEASSVKRLSDRIPLKGLPSQLERQFQHAKRIINKYTAKPLIIAKQINDVIHFIELETGNPIKINNIPLTYLLDDRIYTPTLSNTATQELGKYTTLLYEDYHFSKHTELHQTQHDNGLIKFVDNNNNTLTFKGYTVVFSSHDNHFYGLGRDGMRNMYDDYVKQKLQELGVDVLTLYNRQPLQPTNLNRNNLPNNDTSHFERNDNNSIYSNSQQYFKNQNIGTNIQKYV